MIKKRHLHRRKAPERCFIVYSKSRFLRQADFLRCLDTYLYVRGWIYEQSLICYFLNIVLACCLLVIGRTEGVTGRDRSAGQRSGNGVCRAGQRAKISKNRRAARRKKSFLRAFSDFFKKLFRAQNPCYRLFSPVLRTPTRACVFIIFEKIAPKNFFEKSVDTVRTECYTVSTVKERHPAGRLDRDSAHCIGHGARPL